MLHSTEGEEGEPQNSSCSEDGKLQNHPACRHDRIFALHQPNNDKKYSFLKDQLEYRAK